MGILIYIIAWAFMIVVALGLVGLVIQMIMLLIASCSKKDKIGPLPWWVFFH